MAFPEIGSLWGRADGGAHDGRVRAIFDEPPGPGYVMLAGMTPEGAPDGSLRLVTLREWDCSVAGLNGYAKIVQRRPARTRITLALTTSTVLDRAQRDAVIAGVGRAMGTQLAGLEVVSEETVYEE